VWDAHHPQHQVVDIVLATMAFFDVIGDRELPTPDDPWTDSMINLMQLVLLDNEGRVGEMVELLEPTIDGLRELGDRWGLAMALSQQAMVQSLDANYEDALVTWDEAIPLLNELGAAEDSEFSRMQVMGLRIAVAEGEGVEELRQELIGLLADARRTGDRRVALITQMGLGHVEHAAGNDEAAIEHLEDVLGRLDTVATFGGGQMEAMIRAGLAGTRAFAGDLDGGRSELAVASRLAVRTRDMPIVSQVASTAAILAHLEGDHERSARVLGASEAIRGRADRMNPDVRRLIEDLRTSMGAERFEELHAEGRSLARDEAIALALPDHGAVS
jgi:hypothetical protein